MQNPTKSAKIFLANFSTWQTSKRHVPWLNDYMDVGKKGLTFQYLGFPPWFLSRSITGKGNNLDTNVVQLFETASNRFAFSSLLKLYTESNHRAISTSHWYKLSWKLVHIWPQANNHLQHLCQYQDSLWISHHPSLHAFWGPFHQASNYIWCLGCLTLLPSRR